MDIPSTSVEYLQATVAASADPTTATVNFAFTNGAAPSSWTAGSWVAGSLQNDGDVYTARARILVGPGATTLPSGNVTVWVKVSAAPEAVVRAAGAVRVV